MGLKPDRFKVSLWVSECKSILIFHVTFTLLVERGVTAITNAAIIITAFMSAHLYKKKKREKEKQNIIVILHQICYIYICSVIIEMFRNFNFKSFAEVLLPKNTMYTSISFWFYFYFVRQIKCT